MTVWICWELAYDCVWRNSLFFLALICKTKQKGRGGQQELELDVKSQARSSERGERKREKRLSRKLWRQVAGFPSFWPGRRELSLLRHSTHPDCIGSISKLRPSSSTLKKIKKKKKIFIVFLGLLCRRSICLFFCIVCEDIDELFCCLQRNR